MSNAAVSLVSNSTCVQVEGRGQGDPLLAALGSSLVQYGINVNSAQQENDDGQVFSVFKVTTKEGKQVPKVCVTLLCSSVTWGGIVTRRGGG